MGTPTLTYSGGALPAGTNLSALIGPERVTLTQRRLEWRSRSIAATYDPTAVNLDFLRPGETLTIRYGVAVSDGTSKLQYDS